MKLPYRDRFISHIAKASAESIILSTQVKQMAAVLLRRLLSSSFEEIYPGLTLEMQTAIKTELLTSIQQESTPNIRKKVCDIAAELCRNLIGNAAVEMWSPYWVFSLYDCVVTELSIRGFILFTLAMLRWTFLVVMSLLDDDGNNQWPELLKFLFDSVNSDSVNLREAALHIFWWVHFILKNVFRLYAVIRWFKSN